MTTCGRALPGGNSGRTVEEDGLRLAGALWRFWYVRGHYSEGRQWLGRALARTQPGVVGEDGPTSEEPSAARAKALSGAGNLALGQSDHAGARALYEESLTIQRQLGDQGGIAGSLNNLGMVASAQGDYAGARALYEESLTILRPLGHQQFLANVLSSLGHVAYGQGDYGEARALYAESLTIRRQLGDIDQGISYALMQPGDGGLSSRRLCCGAGLVRGGPDDPAAVGGSGGHCGWAGQPGEGG